MENILKVLIGMALLLLVLVIFIVADYVMGVVVRGITESKT